jgi:hypothetical protein
VNVKRKFSGIGFILCNFYRIAFLPSHRTV